MRFIAFVLIVLDAVAAFRFVFDRQINRLNSSRLSAVSDKGKKTWELGRFIRTASFYNAFRIKIPFLSTKSGSKKISRGDTLYSDKMKEFTWGPLDDVVMGGASKSNLEFGGEFNGEWKGFVTTANNGGFVGIRTKLLSPSLDMSSCDGVIIRVKGDGQRYKFIMRDDENWNGIAWTKSFDTVPNTSIPVKIPFKELIPTKFAKVVKCKSFDKNNVLAFQISLSKFEYDGGLNPKFTEGPFNFQLESITSY